MYTYDDITILIVFFNGDSEIVSRVKKMSAIFTDIVIVDNGSEYKKEIIDILYKIENVKIIHNEKNMGIAYALNQGLIYADTNKKKLLLTLDQDSEISKDTIKMLMNKINIDKGVVSVGPSYGSKKKIGNRRKEKRVNFLITSGNLVDVKTALYIGGYDNNFFVDCVDIDFSFNLLLKGYKLLQINEAYMIHKIGEFEKGRFLHIRHLAHKPNRYYYKYRNNILIYKKYYHQLPFLCMKLLFSLCIETIRLILIEKDKKVKLIYAWRGIRAGLTSHQYKN